MYDAKQRKASFLLDDAEEALKLKKYDKAILKTTECLRYAAYPEAFITRGTAYFKKGDLYSAMPDLKEGIVSLERFF